MKKILPYIFILTIVVQLFAPFSVGIKNGRMSISETKKAEAVQPLEKNEDEGITSPFINAEINVDYIEKNPTSVKISVTIIEEGTSKLFIPAVMANNYLSLEVTIQDAEGNKARGIDKNPKEEFVREETNPLVFDFKDLTPSTNYKAQIILYANTESYTAYTLKPQTIKEPLGKKIEDFTTLAEGDDSARQEVEDGTISSKMENLAAPTDIFNCSVNNLRGCLAEFFYLALFKPTAFLFGLAGKALDFTLQYSLDDDSYRSVFVVEGWGIVRDICNIFFIFILLYIAFKIILGIKGKADPKGLIVNVIIIGLLINFSLFATRIIIDASNILSRVFYNTEVINIGNEKSKTGTFGEIRLSEALVTKVNPVEILANPGKIEKVETIGEEQDLDTNPAISDKNGKEVSKDLPVTLGGFIIICILSAAICLAGTVVFLNLTLVFVLRVVMLWIAMILSPLAFFTYTDPDLAKLPKVGFRNWAKDTAKMAFTAPVFCFFVYVIISFLGSGFDMIKDVASGSSVGNFDFILRIAVPFAFLLVLLTQAKKTAVSLAGEAGKAVSNFGGDIAGKAIGLATGGASLAMRGTIGALGAGIAKNKKMTEWEDKGGFKGFIGRNVRNVGSSVGRMSFDARNTGWGQKAATGLGIGKSVQEPLASISKKGSGAIGNVELTLKGIERRQENRDKLRPKTEEEKEKERQEKLAAKLAIANAPKLKKAEEARDKAKQAYDDAQEDLKLIDPKKKKEKEALQKEVTKKKDEYRKARAEVDNIKNGGSLESGITGYDKDGKPIANGYATSNGNISKEIIDAIQKAGKANSDSITKNQIELDRLERIRDEKAGEMAKAAAKLKTDPGYVDKTNQLKTTQKAIETEQAQKKRLEIKIKQAERSHNQGEATRLSREKNVAVYNINNLVEEETKIKEELKPMEDDLRKIEAGIKEIDEEIEGEEQITEGLEKEKEEITKDKETAEKAKLYAEQNGGLGESQKTYSNKIKKLKEEMEESGQTGDKKKFNEARKWESHNFFDWAQTGGLGVGFAKRREMAHGLYSAIGKQDKK